MLKQTSMNLQLNFVRIVSILTGQNIDDLYHVHRLAMPSFTSTTTPAILVTASSIYIFLKTFRGRRRRRTCGEDSSNGGKA